MKMHSGLAGSATVVVGPDVQRRALPFAPTRSYQPERPRTTRGLAVGSIALAAGTVLGGCATPVEHDAAAWRVQPVMRTSQSDPAAVVQSYTALANQYEGEARWAQAAEAWRKASLVQPDNPDLHTAMGVALTRSQRVLQAIEAFRAATALRPDSARTLNNLGFALTLEGRDDEAQRVLHRALAADPSHVQARANLSAVERRLALRGAPELIHGATPAAVAALQATPPAPAQPAPVVLAQVPNPAPTLTVQQAPNLPPLPIVVAVDSPVVPPVLPAAYAAVVVSGPSEAMPLARPSPAVAASPTAPIAPVVTAVPAPVVLDRVMPAHPLAMQAGSVPVAPAAVVGDAPAASSAAAPVPAADANAPVAQAFDVPARPLAELPAARVAVVNGMGVTGAAAHVREMLRPQGVASARLLNQPGFREASTVVHYRKGFEQVAQRVAASLPQGARLVLSGALDARTDVRVMLGHDRKAVLADCVAKKACVSGATVAAAAR